MHVRVFIYSIIALLLLSRSLLSFCVLLETVPPEMSILTYVQVNAALYTPISSWVETKSAY